VSTVSWALTAWLTASFVVAPDGTVARFPLRTPDDLPQTVRDELVSGVERALTQAGLRVAAIEASCEEASCYAAALGEADATLGVAMAITAEGSDYAIVVSLLAEDGSVRGTREAACEICRHDEVVERTVGLVTALAEDLAPSPEPAIVSVVSSPPGATVSIDGVAVGHTPYEAEISEGPHTIRVEGDGHEAAERTIESRAGARVDEAFELRKSFPLSPKTETTIGWAALGVGAAAIIGGAVLVAIDGNEIRSDCSGDNVDSNGVCRYRHKTLVGGAILLSGGILVAGGGIGLVLHGRKRAGRNSEVSLVPGGLRGRF
jgi:hypothetical protein